MTNRRPQRGLTLIELLIAVALAAFVVAALDSVLTLGLRAQAEGRQTNDLVSQGRFALDRMAATARSIKPKPLTTPPGGTTGNWFEPTLYCFKSGKKTLVETVVTDINCDEGAVIADNVIAFSAQLPAGAGPVDRPSATLRLTLQSAGGQAVTLSTSVRLGGGAK